MQILELVLPFIVAIALIVGFGFLVIKLISKAQSQNPSGAPAYTLIRSQIKSKLYALPILVFGPILALLILRALGVH